MARIRIDEIQAAHGLSDAQMSELLWSDSKPHTRQVLFGRAKKKGMVSIRLDQLQAIHDRYPNDEIIDYEKET
jgi:hypothetical protein